MLASAITTAAAATTIDLFMMVSFAILYFHMMKTQLKAVIDSKEVEAWFITTRIFRNVGIIMTNKPKGKTNPESSQISCSFS